MMPKTIQLLGLRHADLTIEQAAAWIAARPPDAVFGYVVTPNADHFARLRREPALAVLYRDSLLCLLDSRVVRRAACLLGLPAPRLCPGSDLTAHLLARHLDPADRITVIGMTRAELRLLGLAGAAHHAPPFGFEHDPAALAEAVAFVLAHPARYVFLAVGSPRQELLASAIARTGRATGTALCIGAALEFLTGARRRAPGWMRAAGLEWLHRLAAEPRRLARRYVIDCPPVFLFLAREALSSTTAPAPLAAAGPPILPDAPRHAAPDI